VNDCGIAPWVHGWRLSCALMRLVGGAEDKTALSTRWQAAMGLWRQSPLFDVSAAMEVLPDLVVEEVIVLTGCHPGFVADRLMRVCIATMWLEPGP
jgi:hypothetical protein